MKSLPDSQTMSRHFGAVLEANSRPGPGRGPAPVGGPERAWWVRWRMFDDLLWEAIDALTPGRHAHLLSHWPDGWPAPESGLLSIRRMEWVRVHMIDGRTLDARGRLFA